MPAGLLCLIATWSLVDSFFLCFAISLDGDTDHLNTLVSPALLGPKPSESHW